MSLLFANSSVTNGHPVEVTELEIFAETDFVSFFTHIENESLDILVTLFTFF